LHYWRTGSKLEVDFILQHKNGGLIGIEVKGSGKVTPQDYKGLLAVADEFPNMKKMIVCNESHARTTETGIDILPIEIFLKDLWADRINK
jgi:predicted AAA+ superfamily ATPase